MLTGHGCYNDYLFRFGKADTKVCFLCGATPDTAEHAVFECDAFYHSRRTACVYLGVDELTADNVVAIMLQSKVEWQRVSNLVWKIMTTRESEERRRQHATTVDGQRQRGE